MHKPKGNPRHRTERQVGLLALLFFAMLTSIWLYEMLQPVPAPPVSVVMVQPTSTPIDIADRSTTPAPPPTTATIGCDVADLYDAVATADHVLIDCAEPLVLPQTLHITHDLSIAGAAGQVATLDGNYRISTMLDVRDGAKLTLYNLIVQNSQRTGIRVRSGTLSAINCTLRGHGSVVNRQIYGDALVVNAGQEAYLRECYVEKNIGRASVLVETAAQLTITHSMFRENRHEIAPIINYGEVSVYGSIFRQNTGEQSGVLRAEGASRMGIANSTFTDNISREQGGAIFVGENAMVTIERSTFRDNNAFQGDAIYSEGDLTLGQLNLTSNRRGCVMLLDSRVDDPHKQCH